MADDTDTIDATSNIPEDPVPNEVLEAFVDVVSPALEKAFIDALARVCDGHGYVKRERGTAFYETGRAQGLEDGFMRGVRATLAHMSVPEEDRQTIVLAVCMARDE